MAVGEKWVAKPRRGRGRLDEGNKFFSFNEEGEDDEKRRARNKKGETRKGRQKHRKGQGRNPSWRGSGLEGGRCFFFSSLLSQEYKSGKVGVEEGHVDIPCNNMKDLPTYLHRLIPLLPPVLLHHQPHELDY